MTRLRASLFLLAITAILFSAMPGTPAASLTLVFPPQDYILCSCKLCATSDVDCQISPSGYTIACADYYRSHC